MTVKRKNKKRQYWKLGFAIIIDLADLTIGRYLGMGMIFDVLAVFVAYLLFGKKGLLAVWEMLLPADTIDGFVPTFTLLALSDQPQFALKAK